MAQQSFSDVDDIQEQMIDDVEKLTVEISILKASLRTSEINAKEKIEENDLLRERVQTMEREAENRMKELHERQEMIKLLKDELAEAAKNHRSSETEKELQMDNFLKEIEDLKESNSKYQTLLRQESELVAEMNAKMQDRELSGTPKVHEKSYFELCKEMKAKDKLIDELRRQSANTLTKIKRQQDTVEAQQRVVGIQQKAVAKQRIDLKKQQDAVEKQQMVVKKQQEVVTKQQRVIEIQQAALTEQMSSLALLVRNANHDPSTHINKKRKN